ncbi:MAG: LysR substrate-binding domain-containing protein, partial [Alphaproteobacteria bacterium]
SMPKWEEWLKAAGCDVDVTAGPRFSHSSMVIEAAVMGHGVALIGRVTAGDYLATGKLVRPFGPETTTRVDYGYYLVCLEGVAERRDIAAFRAWALKEAKQDRASTGTTTSSPTH